MPSISSKIPDLLTDGPILPAMLGCSEPDAVSLRRIGMHIRPPISILSMIDTGASMTVIRDTLPALLDLLPVGVIPVSTPTTHRADLLAYRVKLMLTEYMSFEVTAVAAPLDGQHVQCLIGRDVLARGTLVYLGIENLLAFSI